MKIFFWQLQFIKGDIKERPQSTVAFFFCWNSSVSHSVDFLLIVTKLSFSLFFILVTCGAERTVANNDARASVSFLIWTSSILLIDLAIKLKFLNLPRCNEYTDVNASKRWVLWRYYNSIYWRWGGGYLDQLVTWKTCFHHWTPEIQ